MPSTPCAGMSADYPHAARVEALANALKRATPTVPVVADPDLEC